MVTLLKAVILEYKVKLFYRARSFSAMPIHTVYDFESIYVALQLEFLYSIKRNDDYGQWV
jgi:hypothetical protein